MSRERFKLLPLVELFALTKDKLNEKLAPSRAKLVKTKIELEIANLGVSLDEKKSKIQEVYAKDKDFKAIDLKNLVQDISLLELDIDTYTDILEQLFPIEEAK